MRIPKIITHKNLQPILRQLESDYATSAGVKANYQKWSESVLLEFPLGEIAENSLKTACLVGMFQQFPKNTAPIKGNEGFSAQGLEGKMIVMMPLFNALINMRDNLPINRGRIVMPNGFRVVSQ